MSINETLECNCVIEGRGKREEGTGNREEGLGFVPLFSVLGSQFSVLNQE
jgi:hypothetical protein